MKYKAIIAAVLLTVFSGCTADSSATVTETSVPVTETVTQEAVTVYSELLECRHYSESNFLISDARGSAYEYEGELLCGVVPHHLTAGYFISGFLKSAALSEEKPDTVVIIAPMHYESNMILCTTEKSWATPFGIMETDTDISKIFTETLGAVCDDEMLQHDHSAASHIPFVKNYLPESKTACLLVSPEAGKDFPALLAQTLTEISETKRCLFLFSIDFSHYLDPDEADFYDEQTLEAVLSGNVDAIEKMNNNNVDSPYCLSAYVRLSEALGGSITAADNSNTWEIAEKPYNSEIFPEGVTSYFVFITSE